MAKVTITLEDKGEKSLTFLMEISGIEDPAGAVTPAMMTSVATRAMFENGMLGEAAAVALAALSEGDLPSAAIIAHFNKKRE